MSATNEPADAKLAILTQFLSPTAKRAFLFMRGAKQADHFLDGSLECACADARWHMRSHISFAQAKAEWEETAGKIGGTVICHTTATGAAQKIAWRKVYLGDVDAHGDVELRYVFADYTAAEPTTFVIVEAYMTPSLESFDSLCATLEPSLLQCAPASD